MKNSTNLENAKLVGIYIYIYANKDMKYTFGGVLVGCVTIYIYKYIYTYILKLDGDGMIQLEFIVVYNDWIVELDCVVP